MSNLYLHFTNITCKSLQKHFRDVYMKIYYNLFVFQNFEMKIFLTPLTIRLVLQICVLFIIGTFVPIPDRLRNQTFVNISLCVSPKRSLKTSLYVSCKSKFLTCPLPIDESLVPQSIRDWYEGTDDEQDTDSENESDCEWS